MVERIIAAFSKNFVDFDVNIETVVGEVLGPEGYKVSGKKTGNKIDARIIYKSGHVIRYALNDLLTFAKRRVLRTFLNMKTNCLAGPKMALTQRQISFKKKLRLNT